MGGPENSVMSAPAMNVRPSQMTTIAAASIVSNAALKPELDVQFALTTDERASFEVLPPNCGLDDGLDGFVVNMSFGGKKRCASVVMEHGSGKLPVLFWFHGDGMIQRFEFGNVGVIVRVCEAPGNAVVNWKPVGQVGRRCHQ